MNTILMVAAITLGQYSGYGAVYSHHSVYTRPVYTYSVHTPIRFDIRYTGRIHSRQYTPIMLPNRSTIQVPVINGILPHVRIVYLEGYEVRICTYDTGMRYRGGIPQYQYVGSNVNTRTTIELPPTPVRETRPIDSTGLPERAVQESQPAMQVLPRRDTEQSTELDDPVSALPIKETKKAIPTRETSD
jgi:hypothetical protein